LRGTQEVTGFTTDYVNQIAINLRDRYRRGLPILKELVQNADDAGAKSLAFGFHPGHGPDFAMALARLLGFDLCPRLKELKQRHLFVPRGTVIPPEIAAVCEANVDTALIEKH